MLIINQEIGQIKNFLVSAARRKGDRKMRVGDIRKWKKQEIASELPQRLFMAVKKLRAPKARQTASKKYILWFQTNFFLSKTDIFRSFRPRLSFPPTHPPSLGNQILIFDVFCNEFQTTFKFDEWMTLFFEILNFKSRKWNFKKNKLLYVPLNLFGKGFQSWWNRIHWKNFINCNYVSFAPKSKFSPRFWICVLKPFQWV